MFNNYFLSNLNTYEAKKEKKVNQHLNDYTLKDYSVLYARGRKKSDSKPELTKKTRKKLENEPISENVLDLKEERELKEQDSQVSADDVKEELVEHKGEEDALLSNRMLHSILSLTSSAYTPNFFDIIPILYAIKDEVLNITGSFRNEHKLENRSTGNMKRISGIFMNNDRGEVERLLLSIPSSELDRLSQSTKYKTEVEASEAPIQIISLSRGFFTKVYELVVYPYLSQVSEEEFDTKYEGKLGFMDYVTSMYDKNKTYKEYDASQLYRFSIEEFDEVFANYSVASKKEFDTSVFPERMLASLSQMAKCVKDLVYFNSCLLLLKQILGRKPNDLEILYSFVPDDKSEEHKQEEQEQSDWHMMSNKLVDVITYSESEISHRLDTFFLSFVELVLIKFKKKLKSKSRYYRMILKCVPDGISAMRTRMFVVHPRVIKALKKNFILHLFKLCYDEVKTSALKNSLPLHLPLGTFRLARKALKMRSYLSAIKKVVLLEYKNDPSGYRNVELEKFVKDLVEKNKSRVPFDSQTYEEYVKGLLELERQYERRKGHKESNQFMKRQQQQKLLQETTAKILNVTVERVAEAIDAYRTKEVTATQKMPTYMRRRRGVTTSEQPLSSYYGDMKEDEMYREDFTSDYEEEAEYRRMMRKLAMEALDDRLAKLLFMSHNNLFLDHKPDYDEVIAHLNIPRKTADFIVFTATLQCKEYEVWRIKLSLPDYHFPRPTSRVDTGMTRPEREGASVSNPRLKEPVYVSEFNYDPNTLFPPHKPKKGKRDMFRRMKSIKPNLSTVNDLLLNYKRNYKEYEKILERSPLYSI
ncbi:hypothetical protein MACJ_000719 [Theileria orientalis]|uniref:Uncharacterized protein n=1 Tax=Theileria orientalis TaxID=68886 RepID=A0A976M4J3_THEOR|nr:hypothetical protein MACJ_000719 [Theileria orientalis]